MEQILRQFKTGNLFDASKTLLEALHIKHTQEEPSPMRYADYYDAAVPQYIQNALQLTQECYYIGEVCDESIAGTSASDTSLAEDIEKLRANAHYQSMMIFAVDILPDSHITRSDMTVLTRAFNRLVYNFPVTLIFRQGDNLSIATCERTEFKQEWRQGQGEKLGRVALLRNVNCTNPHRGHLDILKGLECNDCATFDKLYERWMKVFNSEVLTKKFYNDLFEWYQWAVKPETKVSFPGDADTQDDDREDIDTRVIRLITRLMFVWFIKQKNLVPSIIFDKEYLKTILKDFDPESTSQCNYYQAILQNLFFATLNRPIIEDSEVREFATNNKSKELTNLYRYGSSDKDGGLFSISNEEVIKLFSTVPFLNCGLFECQDKTVKFNNVQRRFYNDGFSRNGAKWQDGTYKYRAVVPNILFFKPEKGLLSIFDKYVFTIEENTPQDVQVALDPELLGKVFENLLGAYNPETKETARNQSGSFYTPREIVQYMVNESLVAHLKRTVDENLEPQYRQLLDFTTESVELTQQQKSAILHSLFTCKILDPACGSGAFPMGMLQQMVHILQQVDPTNEQWREVLLNMAVDESRRAFGIVDEEERRKKLREIEETFNNGLNSPDYTRKLYIIESCIYGVDIQPIAMLITRLRFFITLICEQKDIRRDQPEENFGIKTLPNLESKFVAANSLIDADIHKYNEDWTNDEVLAILKNELIAIRRRHFYTRKRSEKIRLLREDEQKRQQIHAHINRLVGEPNAAKIAELTQRIADHEQLMERYQGEDWVEEAIQKDLFSDPEIIRVDRNKRERERIKNIIAACRRDIEHEENKCTPQGFEAAVLQVTDWNPYDQNSVSPFLDMEWMYGVTEGFDIVIGNPPYIQLQADRGKLADLYEPCRFETFTRMGDIYCLFYERGYQLLKEEAILCYITSNKWMRTGYGEDTRNFFASKTNPELLIDFNGIKVFESATVDTNILLFSKKANEKATIGVIVTKDNKDRLNELSTFVENNNVICSFDDSAAWVVLSQIENNIKKKIKAIGTKLGDWNLRINFGIKTGNNDAFKITEEQRNLILSNCATDEELQATKLLIHPILQGRDVQRYSYNWAGTYLIALLPSRNYDIEQYPSVKRFLLSFAKDKLVEEGLNWVVDGHLEEYCQKKLTQCGQFIEIDGRSVVNTHGQRDKSRKRSSNKWFETQDPIAFWQEFSNTKILWKRVGSIIRFSYDNTGIYGLDSTCFTTGEHLEYLCCLLNSKMGHYLLKDSPKTGTGDLLISVQAVEPIHVPYPDQATEDRLKELLTEQMEEVSQERDDEINNIVCGLYGLTNDEIEYVKAYQLQ